MRYDHRPASSISTAASSFKFRGEHGSYKFRCLPYTAGKWYVGGECVGKNGENEGGGVLEWCYDKKDAEELMFIMKSDPRFVDLQVGCDTDD